MALFSIGIMPGRDAHADIQELAWVVADAPDERVTGVYDAGDAFGFQLALSAVSDALLVDETPTPLGIAVQLAGREATVHQVMDDGTLRGWRRDYLCLEPSLTSS